MPSSGKYLQHISGHSYEMVWPVVPLKMGRTRDTYKETGDPARQPGRVAGQWENIKWKSLRWRIFLLGGQEQLRQDKNLLHRTSPWKDPFHFYPINPLLIQFQQSAGATPLSGLSGQDTENISSTPLQYSFLWCTWEKWNKPEHEF